MERILIEAAARALVLALAAGAVMKPLRMNAAGRHAIWTVVLVAMLVLPLWTRWGPKTYLPIMSSRPVSTWTTAAWPNAGTAPRFDASREVTPLGQTTIPAQTAAAPASVSWRTIALVLYGCVALALFGRLMLGTLRAHLLIRRAERDGDRWTSADCAAPVTVGWLRPIVILPRGWQAWPARQLEAVTIHEREHARRHDPLIQWLALLNRAVFWVHPLAWWLEHRLASLAEAACDAAVLSRGHHRADYCEYLLSLARSVTAAGARVDIVGTAMPGPALSQRVRRILNEAPEAPLSSRRLACALSACALLSGVTAATVLTAAPLKPRPIAPAARLQLPIAGGDSLPEYWFDEDEWHREVAPLMTAEDMSGYERVRTSAERDAFITQFWKRRDPTPDTAVNEGQIEFTRRIDYAREHLANADSAAVPGYETDRGRWYVMFGPPDKSQAGTAGSEEWRYRSLTGFGSDVVIRFDPTSIFGCTYRGGRYRIVSPAPRQRFESTRAKAFALSYPDRFVYLSFPIDSNAVSIRWGLRARSGAETTFGEARGPIDYVQGAIGADVTGARPGVSPPILEHVRGLRLFEANGIACTEQLPADTYTLLIQTTLLNGEMRREELTFVVE
jgi:GWxTD domain-containing protein